MPHRPVCDVRRWTLNSQKLGSLTPRLTITNYLIKVISSISCISKVLCVNSAISVLLIGKPVTFTVAYVTITKLETGNKPWKIIDFIVLYTYVWIWFFFANGRKNHSLQIVTNWFFFCTFRLWVDHGRNKLFFFCITRVHPNHFWTIEAAKTSVSNTFNTTISLSGASSDGHEKSTVPMSPPVEASWANNGAVFWTLASHAVKILHPKSWYLRLENKHWFHLSW